MSRSLREQISVAAERAVLVHVQLQGQYVDERDPFSELRALTETAGAQVVGELLQNRRKPFGRTYLGPGKVEELSGLVKATGAVVVIFDNDLSPAQIRSLERSLECKIIDRSELILDIFANRATTHEAKLQVQIAQHEYTFPRLRALWDHLGQIVGGAPVGIGTRGPGEQQLEIDRRLARQRLASLERELKEIQARKRREVEQRNVEHFTVGLVGYTNAGKSSLFNRLTAGGAFAHPKLFATLSTRVEKWDMGGGNAVLLSDTVGFIRNLPHHLVASFRSTLEETVSAQLLVIVVDVSDPHAEMHLDTVRTTLDEIGAAHQPRLIALNKIDRLGGGADVLVWVNRMPEAIPVSAVTGDGLDELARRVREHLVGGVREVSVTTALGNSKAISFLENRTEVLERTWHDESVTLRVRVGRRQIDQILAQGGAFTIDGLEPREAIRTLWGETRALPALAMPPPHERFHPA